MPLEYQAALSCQALQPTETHFGACESIKLRSMGFPQAFSQRRHTMEERHLKSLRTLTQFERCWTIIDSHLKCIEENKKLKAKLTKETHDGRTDSDRSN